MYTRRWSTSEPKHEVVVERDVKVGCRAEKLTLL